MVVPVAGCGGCHAWRWFLVFPFYIPSFPSLLMALSALVLRARAWLWRVSRTFRMRLDRTAVRADAVIMDSMSDWIAGVAVFADGVSSGVHEPG